MKYLMDNAVKANENLEIALGVELTPEQIKALDEDIIWYVEEIVNGVKVLVPRIYLASLTLESLETGTSTIKSGGDMTLVAEEEISNTGSITSGNNLIMDAKEITNKTIGDGKQAEIKGEGAVSLAAENNIVNTGGHIEGGELLALATETGDIINETEVFTESYGGDIKSETGAQAGLVSKGDLLIDSGADFINKGASVKADGNAQVAAENDITFETVEIRNKTNYTYGGGYAVNDRTKNIGSSFDIGESLAMKSDNNINIIGSEVTVEEDAYIKAERDFNVLSATDTSYYKSKRTDKGFLSSKTTAIEKSSTENIASSLNIGGNLKAETEIGDINIIGSELDTIGNTELDAGKNFNLMAGYNTDFYDKQTKKSGWFTGGSLFSKEIDIKGKGNKTAVDSVLNAGNVIIKTKEDAFIEGSQINTENIYAQTEGDFTITSAQEESYEYSFHEKTSFNLGIPSFDFEGG
jgi:filamentous hemagglutinin